MSQDVQSEIARRILTSLYDAWSEHDIISLDPIQAEGGWDDSIFNTVVEKLEKQRGLIKSYNSSNTYTITTDGIIHAEDNGIVPEAEAENHRQIRTHILKYLSDLYDREGSRADEHLEKIAEGAPADKDDILVDLEFLTDKGDVKETSSSSFQITENGLRNYRGADYEDII